MRLAFTHAQFLDVFGAYNTTLWPVATALWLATVAAAVELFRGRGRPSILAALLTVHWAWSGMAYHAVFLARINPAARLFAGLFLLDAAAFVWLGLMRRRLNFDVGRMPRHVFGFFFVASTPWSTRVLHSWRV